MELPGLKLSEKEQFEAIKQAAESGNISAMLKLSEFYENGIGTAVNREMADYWRNKGTILPKK